MRGPFGIRPRVDLGSKLVSHLCVPVLVSILGAQSAADSDFLRSIWVHLGFPCRVLFRTPFGARAQFRLPCWAPHLIPFLVLPTIPSWIPLGRGKFLAGLRRPGMCAATGLHEIQNMEPMAGQVTGRQTGTFVPEC